MQGRNLSNNLARNNTVITVEAQTGSGEWTHHSEHESWSDAVDQCDMVMEGLSC